MIGKPQQYDTSAGTKLRTVIDRNYVNLVVWFRGIGKTYGKIKIKQLEKV